MKRSPNGLIKRRNFLKCGFAGLSWMGCQTTYGGYISTNDLHSISKGRFTCEAMYFKTTPRGIQCGLCPNNCNVNDIRPGSCRTKYLKNGKLISIAYGNPYFVKTETPEIESLYHFLPGERILAIGTAGCTLTCQYCKVFAVSQKGPEEIAYSEFFPQQVIDYCLKKGIKVIAYTYTEPVAFFEYMLQTSKLARKNGIRNIMVSNGFINESPLRELCQYLDAAIIDVKAFSDSTYQKLTGGSIFPVFNTLKVLKECHVWTEISHLLVPGWTDNFQLLEKMCSWLKENNFSNMPFHFHKFEPAYQLRHLQPTPDAMLEKAQVLASSAGLSYIYSTSIHQQTYCPQCNKAVVERKDNKLTVNHLIKGKCSWCGKEISGIWI
jgi:pyruvate formate lyase activating enzyme